MANITPGNMSKVPPNILNNLPALPPPAGAKSNFINPEDRGYICNIVVTVLFCFTVCLFATRVYTKLYIVRKAGWDDLTCTIAFVGSVAMYILTLWSTILAPVGKHLWDVRVVDAASSNFVTTSAIMVFLSPLALLFTKLTFFLLYFQVFWLLKWLRITVYIGVTLTCAFYGAVSIAQIVLLTPRHGETWLEHSLSKDSQRDQVLSVYLAAIGLGLDILLLVMPMVAVLELQMPKQRKMGVLFIFSIGIFACIGSALSIYYRLVNQRSTDITWNLMPIKLVALVEIFIGISCVCMPAFSKMLHHHRPTLEKWRSALLSRLPSLRSRNSGDATGHSGFPHSNSLNQYPLAKMAQGPYSHLDIETPSPQDATSQPSYEVGQLQSVQI